MTIHSGFQKFCGLIILVIMASFIPTSTVDAKWNGAFTLSSATYSVNEYGGSVTITIRLSGSGTGKKPAIKYETVNGSATLPSDYTSTSGTRTFKKVGSWSFTVPIINDTLSESDETFKVNIYDATNGASLGSPNSAVVTILDDETAGISVTPTSGLTVTEAGGTATFSVGLTKRPSANVSIVLYSSDTTEGAVSLATLTFTTTNWYLAKTVTVIGVSDYVDDGDIAFSIITEPAVSADSNYIGLNASDVAVTNLDDDIAGIAVNPTSGLGVTEAGSTATFTVVLTSQPLLDVTIGLTSSDTTEGTLSPESLTFTTGNWNFIQTVAITGVGDLIADHNVDFTIVTSQAVSTDAQYNGLNASDVLVTNIDDDTVGITVIHAIDLDVTEAGGTATFTVVLNTQPIADVSIGLSSSDTSEGTVSPASLTFTTSNWSMAQSVTVTGVDDDVDDDDIAFSIITEPAVSADSNYIDLNASDVAVTNLDDDTAGIIVSPTGGLSVTEAGSTATFTVVLTSQPLLDVTIDLTSSDTTEGTVSPASLTFTTDNWYLEQTVTVTGVDDSDKDGDEEFTLTAVTSSADPKYSGMAASDILVTCIDDDNSRPLAVPDSYSTLWRNTINVDAISGVLSNDNDADGDPLIAVLGNRPSVEQGSLVLYDDGSFTFTPADYFSGDATFTYSADDGLVTSSPITVTIHVVVNRLFLPLIVRP